MKKTLGDYFAIFIGIVGSIATLIGFYQTYYQDLNDQGKYGVIFLGVISLYFLGTNIYLVSKYRKKVSYADVFESLNYGFSKLHSIDRLDNIETSKLIDLLKNVCSHISNSYKEVKGHHIGVCIKLISKKENDVLVFTLVRDENSSQTRPSGKNDTITHRITENTDFNFIYDDNISNESHNGYFFSNNLPYDYDYSNTRLKQKAQKWPPPKILFLNWLIRQLYWPLKYKSTIVVPILPLQIDERKKEKISGFLCIDSPKILTFNEQYDVQILKGIADGIYNKILTLQNNLENEKSQHTS